MIFFIEMIWNWNETVNSKNLCNLEFSSSYMGIYISIGVEDSSSMVNKSICYHLLKLYDWIEISSIQSLDFTISSFGSFYKHWKQSYMLSYISTPANTI